MFTMTRVLTLTALDATDSSAGKDQRSNKDGGRPGISSAALAETLLRHVWMNSIADYYDVPKLAELSRRKIQKAQEDSWDPKCLPDCDEEGARPLRR